MANIFDQAAPAPKSSNPFAQVDLSKSVANTFDFGKAAGGQQGASGVGVSDNMLASKQLGNILAKDNPLMVQARTRAQEAAAARGLGNSSIAVGAGQTAMNDVALPLAQQDAGTFFDAAKFNASESNNFARDANAFGRQAAMAQFGALSDAETRNHQYGFDSYERGQDRDFTRTEREASQAYQAGENTLQRSFQTGERIGAQDFSATQAVLDREQQNRIQQLQESGVDRRQAESIAAQEREAAASRGFTAEQASVDRDWRANQAGQDRAFTREESQANRSFQAADREDTQAFNQSLQTQSQEFQASQQALQNDFTRSMQRSGMPEQMLGNFASGMQQAIGNIMSDPNMTPEQKTSAMENYYAYANSQMSWMATFYNAPMPNMRTGGTINPIPAPVPVSSPPNVGPINTPPDTQIATPGGWGAAGGNHDRRDWA